MDLWTIIDDKCALQMTFGSSEQTNYLSNKNENIWKKKTARKVMERSLILRLSLVFIATITAVTLFFNRCILFFLCWFKLIPFPLFLTIDHLPFQMTTAFLTTPSKIFFNFIEPFIQCYDSSGANNCMIFQLYYFFFF